MTSCAVPLLLLSIQSVQAPEKDVSTKAELASFKAAEGYDVNLFADETDGVANPVCMRWGPAGRLWVLCTWAYPQAKPSDRPDDKLLILSDTDGDGRADKTTVFAGGLSMPTGFALGHGGAYVGQGADLLHLADTDGDDRADRREVLFTGFGTGDTHQNINSFTWSPGGELFFCQGLHSFARVETPWGIVRLDEHGVWRLRPLRRRLHAYRGCSGQNPWGITFGPWGEPFVKGNNTELSELLPVMVYTDRYHPPLDIGRTQIKSMIVKIIDSPSLPQDIQGDVLIAGYFGRLIDRFSMERDGSGHRLKPKPPLLTSSHRSFRPVDLSVGPDGAIYVADWYNPIIGHYQASFRHPHRDKTHGRIWRITAKSVPVVRVSPVHRLSAAELCAKLASDVRWERLQARRRLADLPSAEAVSAVKAWIDGLDPKAEGYEHLLYRAIGVCESHESVDGNLLGRLLAAQEPLARAYGARVVGRWHDRLEDPLKLLDRCVNDDHPRVRLEAVVACSDIRRPESMAIAAKAAGRPMDRFLVAALTQTVHALAPLWQPALKAGTIRFEDPAHLVFVLRAFGGKNVVGQVRGLLKSNTLKEEGRRPLRELLARIGTPEDLASVFDAAVKDGELLRALVSIAPFRATPPAGNVDPALEGLIAGAKGDARDAALRLAGLWKRKGLTARLKAVALDAAETPSARAAAIRSWAELDPGGSAEPLNGLVSAKQPAPVCLAALEARAARDLDGAMADGLKLIAAPDGTEVGGVLAVLMQRDGAPAAMVRALKAVDVSNDDAKRIIRWMSGVGQGDPALMGSLRRAMGAEPGRAMPYDEAIIRRVADAVRKSGNSKAGREIFRSSITGCVACHRVAGLDRQPVGFERGPELSAVGSGLPVEIIIESILWPKRQVKEGYEAMAVLLNDGRVVSGYPVTDTKQELTIRDVSTGEVRTFAAGSIRKRKKIGTLMPEGLAAFLTQDELRDLAAYLASLRGEATR